MHPHPAASKTFKIIPFSGSKKRSLLEWGTSCENLASVEYADAFIPLDGIFAEASMGVDPKLWAADGVHPTAAGAQLIADRYADAFDKLFPLMK